MISAKVGTSEDVAGVILYSGMAVVGEVMVLEASVAISDADGADMGVKLCEKVDDSSRSSTSEAGDRTSLMI